MRSVALLTLVLLAVTACNVETQYKSASEFEAAVQSWQLVGKSEDEAISVLSKNNFSCKERVCYRDLRGFPCNQKLNVTLVVNNKGEVTRSAIWKLPNGELPTVCL